MVRKIQDFSMKRAYEEAIGDKRCMKRATKRISLRVLRKNR
jgi:hypothetical protein